ncbi:GNAT family N-acetyltransferase [Salsipaludibacter albus]|uniref:bifunctional acetate--CoA ligase family protein/GNAT family N-acetyltransferase n=1 Tax=Salsipaludibacter albus TaxID=2849650 RepID=UPI001EE44ABB|nr:GNAT family N-acetyltransferase [Salsipaludibacter albus]MBY5163566.1 GNAT family N-acetyltransferase [Salsipaludibacter albus]
MPPDASTGFDQVLRDGTTVHVREIRPDDRERLLGMWERTSPESRRLRFHGHFDLNEETVGRFTDLDPDDEYAVVATLGRGDDERIVAVSRFTRDEDDRGHAEFAALVEDAHQGRGIGSALVRAVARAAHEHGIRTLTGDVLAENSRMLRLIRELGFAHDDRRDHQTVRSDMTLDLGEDFLSVVDRADRRAAQAALRRFFSPTSIAVVGASRDPSSIGGMVFRHVLHGGFAGVVYPVNPRAEVVQSVRAHPTLSDLPEVPEHVLVCVPAPVVNEVVDEAGRLGVRAVTVVSAGFSETGPEGRDRQDELMAIATSWGMRVVGPNCMGVMNATEGVRMNATFSDTFPAPGRVAFSSQSGALGLAVIDHVADLGLGLSTFVSVGNKADVSGNDLILYWEEDPDTDVILLYLESFGNPRKFSRIARRVSRSKPIVAVKSGRTGAGERAASSHTAAISAGDVAVEALFRQAGIIRTDTLEELFDVATLLSSQPLPGGRRVGIVTNAGGPGILAADALESNGLEVPALGPDLQARLEEFLPSAAGVANPVDMIASAGAAGYEQTIRALGASGEVDVVLVIFIPTGSTSTDDVAEAMVAAHADLGDDVPVLAVFMSTTGLPAALERARIPSYAFPEDAARALGRVAAHAAWRRTPLGEVVEPEGVDPDAGRAIVEGALAEAPDGTWLGQADAEALLDAYGVTRPRSAIVASADEAAEVQAAWDTPVVVKVAAAIHKTDVGGIALDLATPDAVRDAVEAMADRLREGGLGEHTDAWLVQEMVDGIEMVVGVNHDPSFGPLILVGLGGTLVELVRDVSVRITPVTDRDVEEMLDGLRTRPLLEGYRGSPPGDVPALTDLVHRVNTMVEDLPEIAELDCNPVFVRPRGEGVVAVDVRVRVAPA